MEIEEMQVLWSEMSHQLEEQKKLTNEIIMQMTQERYSKKFKTLSAYETIGALLCFATALYILLNFQELGTWYLKACGAFTLGFLTVFPILILRALHRIQRLNILDKNYKETLIGYTKAKTYLLRLQQVSIAASFFVMFAVAAVFSKLWSNKDFFMIDRDLWSYVVIGFAVLFVVFISRWGYRHYRRITNSAEAVLSELE
ncbi:MAG: hypothetical protein Mars2KO_16210 [Maribacter sp.]|uniref:hypothetical protein n=1 Tax=Maribacter sp. 2307UL18-2 TaxID=3386274 RepID=UPI0039BC93B1